MINPSAAQAVAIWDVLVAECGNRNDEPERGMFLRYITEETEPLEWRFMGSLGFGGKFYVNGNGWYVGCYREDRTTEGEEAIRLANEKIKAIQAAGP
jgi:hypothetical protein